MRYLRTDLNVADEPCNKCGKPMTSEAPGIVLHAFTHEHLHARIWAHIECLQQLLFKVRKQQSSAIPTRSTEAT